MKKKREKRTELTSYWWKKNYGAGIFLVAGYAQSCEASACDTACQSPKSALREEGMRFAYSDEQG